MPEGAPAAVRTGFGWFRLMDGRGEVLAGAAPAPYASGRFPIALLTAISMTTRDGFSRGSRR